MPKKIDENVKARAVRMVNDHQGEYSSLTAAAAVVARQLGVGQESVRRSPGGTAGAKNDLTTAYNNAAGQTPPTAIISADLGGRTLVGGIYKSGSALGRRNH